MHHVVFEVLPAPNGREPYLAFASRLRPLMDASGGCLALERFDRDDGSGWMLSMQRWADEAALERWRAQGDHCAAQRAGRERLFADYRLRVATRVGERPAPDSAGARTIAVLEWTGDAQATPAAVALASAPPGSLRYTAILDRERHALVTPNAGGDAATQSIWACWAERAAAGFTAAALPFTLCLARVDRDYGPVERAEAPVVLA